MPLYSDGTIRKHKGRNGEWQWQGVISYVGEDGKRHQRAKNLGVECDPKSKDEKGRRGQGRATLPKGKGAAKAMTLFKEWRAELIAEAERADEIASMPDESATLVPEYVRHYIDSKRNVEPRTIIEYRYTAKHLDYPALQVPMRDLTPDHVQEWVRQIEDAGPGKSMQAKAFSLLKYACNHAIDMGHRNARNPCNPVSAPKHRLREPNPLDTENLALLNTMLDNLTGNPIKRNLADGARLALFTGMRQGEVCGLRWKDVEGWRDGRFEGGLIHVNNVIARGEIGHYNKPYPKNRERRNVPVNAELAAFLRSRRMWCMELCALDGKPFTGETYVLGKPSKVPGEGYLSPMYLGHQWSMFVGMTALVGSEGTPPHFHDLRHTFATHALLNGVDVVTVAAILGHRDYHTTLRHYARFLPDKNRDAMDRMGGILSERAHLAEMLPFAPRTGTNG